MLWNVHNDTWDLVMMLVVRLVIYPIWMYTTVRFGTPEHERQLDQRVKFAKKQDATNSLSLNLLDSHAGEADIEDPPIVLLDEEKLIQSRRAQRIRNVSLTAQFLVVTGMQIYLGVKMVGFDFTNEWLQGCLMATLLVTWNVQQAVSHSIIKMLCRETGYLFPNLHRHRMFYDETVAAHRCDLCRDRLRQSYRCKKCDFDCCVACFARRDKVRGEGVLRGDKGAKDEMEVSNTTYLIRSLKLAMSHKLVLGVAVVCLFVTGLTSLLLPSFQGSILDAVIQGNHDQFAQDIKLFICVSVGMAIFGGIKTLSFNLVGAHMANDVRVRLFSSLVVQDIVYFDGANTGDLTSRLSSDTAAMTAPMQSVISSTLSNVLLLVGGVIMCALTSWRLTVLSLTSIYPIAMITRIYSTLSAKLSAKVWAALGDGSAVANQAFANIRSVRSFGTEENEIRAYKRAADDALEKSIVDSWANGGAFALTNFLELTTSVLLLWYGGKVALDKSEGDKLTVGKLITFQLYWALLGGAYTALISVLSSFTRASGAAQRVLALMDSLPDIDVHKGLRLDALHGDIVLDNVSFVYQMRPDNPVINNLSLHIKPGSVTAFVGGSGQGKSTLVHLIMRFYDVTSGRITIDGHNVKDLHMASLHKHMALVSQNTELYAGTILQNLVYGLEPTEWTLEDVYEACRQANAHEFIEQLEDGYQTRIGERGVRLSGGQKQRCSIARAMLRKASLLLLDEASSALDGKSEALVQQAIDQLIQKSGCTVILIAHRLSTVINADQICVVSGGRITEIGRHAELLARGGAYAELVQKQLTHGTDER